MKKIDVKKEFIREKASFTQRVFAFFIDIIICMAIVRLVSIPFNVLNPNINRLNEEISSVTEQYIRGDIDVKTYMTKTTDINYDLAREQGLIKIITIGIYIGYYMMIPFYKNGQTFGKKILRIRVANINEKEELTMNNLVIRSLIINSILVSMITLCFAMLAGKEVFLFGSLIFESIGTIVFIICLIGIGTKKDGRGLHDLLAGTIVVRNEVTVREEVLCEN